MNVRQILTVSGLSAALLVLPMVATASNNDTIDGKELYQNNCAQCHGSAGKPTSFGKSLTPFPARDHTAIAQYVSRDELHRLIAYGVKGTAMTPKKYNLDPLEIDAVIDYIKSFTYTPNLVNGKKRFLAVCSKCHGNDGRATGKLGKNLVMSKLTLEEMIHTIRYGRPGTLMTSKRHQLSNPDIADVGNYVYALRYKADKYNGQKLYGKSCKSCHATPSAIKLIGNAASKRTVSDIDDRLLTLRILHGRHVERSKKAVTKLSSDEIQDIIAYIRDDLK